MLLDKSRGVRGGSVGGIWHRCAHCQGAMHGHIEGEGAGACRRCRGTMLRRVGGCGIWMNSHGLLDLLIAIVLQISFHNKSSVANRVGRTAGPTLLYIIII